MHYDHVHWKDLYFNKWDLMNSVVIDFYFYFIIIYYHLFIWSLFICYHYFLFNFWDLVNLRSLQSIPDTGIFGEYFVNYIT